MILGFVRGDLADFPDGKSTMTVESRVNIFWGPRISKFKNSHGACEESFPIGWPQVSTNFRIFRFVRIAQTGHKVKKSGAEACMCILQLQPDDLPLRITKAHEVPV